MEARTILLTSMVFALWTSTTTGQSTTFCVGKDDGPYCEHCWQPVQCTGGVSTAYSSCGSSMACTVDFGFSFCTPHTDTVCACAGAGDQCDAYNPGYIEHCDASGPILVETCPSATPFCYNGGCVVYPAWTSNDWQVTTPDCFSAIYYDDNGIQIIIADCKDGEYMTSGLECASPPVPACDGSCTGRCPNPVDCTKFFICDGTTALASGDCPVSTFFDIITNSCIASGFTCTFLDGCDIEIGPGGITTTTVGPVYPPPPADDCNSSTVGNKSPYEQCSKQYYVCAELANGQYQYLETSCIGDYYFNTDVNSPFCTRQEDIATCY